MPAITVLRDKATEQSTFVVTVSFTDEAGDAVIPNSIGWKLTDKNRAVVNGKSAETVEPPAASIDLLLKGDDLNMSDGNLRVITVEALYDSSFGSGLPLKAEVRFYIQDLHGIS